MKSFDYYYGLQAEQYSFYRIPKALFTDKRFRTLSGDAKILYGLMLDRMGLSMKNDWRDEEDRVYIIFSIEEIMEYIGCSNKTAVKLSADLTQIGLIEKKRLGFGKPNIIYVKNFCSVECPDADPEAESCGTGSAGTDSVKTEAETEVCRRPAVWNPDAEEGNAPEMYRKSSADGEEPAVPRSVKNTFQEVQEVPFKKCKNDTCRSEKFTSTEVKNLHPNNTYKNNTYKSDMISYLSIHDEKDLWTDVIDLYRKLVCDNIDYKALCMQHPQKEVDEIVELMVEVLLSKKDSMRIAGEAASISQIKSRFQKITYSHIQYVFDCLEKNTTEVKNIKQYMLTVLYNAPATKEHYYQTAVQHELYGG